jgi:hypothetical protein
MNEEQVRAFWDTHEVTEEYLAMAGPVPADALPPAGSRSTHISLRIPQDILDRVKALAALRGRRGYHTLIKEFLVERLYEEEKRESLVGDAQRR